MTAHLPRTQRIKELVSPKTYARLYYSSRYLRFAEIDAELDGKLVAVVGNARSLSDQFKGVEIDACDLIVRFNKCPMPSIESHGSRTDWISTSTSFERVLLENLAARKVLWMSPKRRKMPWWLVNANCLYLLNRDELGSKLPDYLARPTTGLMMLLLLKKSRVAKVKIFGFDFYQSRSLSSEQTIETAPHNFESEESIILNLIQNDDRFERC